MEKNSNTHMKNILIMLPESRIGGPYNSQKRIMESPLNKKYNFLSLYIPRIRKLLNIFIFMKLVMNIRKINPDVIHIYGLQMDGFLMMLLCQVACKNIPVVLAVRGSSSEAIMINPILRVIVNKMEQWTIKKATITYGVSNYVLSWTNIQKYAKVCAGRVFNLPFTEELTDSNEIRRFIREKLGVSHEQIIIISTGRITSEKGFDDLTKIISDYSWPDHVVFCIVGDGNFLPEMKERLKQSLISNRVIFTGNVNNVDEYLLASDIFVICTKHETLCNSIIEAGYYNLPVVATRVGGIPELIDDGHDGYLFANGDRNDCAKKLRVLIDNENMRILLGNRLKESISNKLNNQSICEQLDQIYQKALI